MPKQELMLISTFMEDVHHGNSLQNMKNPSNKTIGSYMTSATKQFLT
jgi:hypothetical protein